MNAREVAADETRPSEYGRTVLRPEQPGFRRALLLAYEHRCAATATGVPEVLEAAHIVPYRDRPSHEPTNGLLLRRDIHALFDTDLLGIDTDYRIRLSDRVLDDSYRLLVGSRIRLPARVELHPDRAALDERFELFQANEGT